LDTRMINKPSSILSAEDFAKYEEVRLLNGLPLPLAKSARKRKNTNGSVSPICYYQPISTMRLSTPKLAERSPKKASRFAANYNPLLPLRRCFRAAAVPICYSHEPHQQTLRGRLLMCLSHSS
jgi:hypothetical protein